LLELGPEEKSIFIVTKGIYQDGNINSESQRYLYEEHTCPINYLQNAEIVMIGDNADPHGLFGYRAAIPSRWSPDLPEKLDVEEIMEEFEMAELFGG